MAFGWEPVGISEWIRDGETVKLHIAFNRCKEEFKKYDQWTWNPVDNPDTND